MLGHIRKATGEGPVIEVGACGKTLPSRPVFAPIMFEGEKHTSGGKKT